MWLSECLRDINPVEMGLYRKVAEEFKERALKELGKKLHSIVLYGSVARKEANEDSDVDLLVVGEDKDIFEDVVKIQTDIDLKHGTLTAVVYLTKEELERFTKSGSPFLTNVMEEGEVLYDDGTFEGIRRGMLATR